MDVTKKREKVEFARRRYLTTKRGVHARAGMLDAKGQERGGKPKSWEGVNRVIVSLWHNNKVPIYAITQVGRGERERKKKDRASLFHVAGGVAGEDGERPDPLVQLPLSAGRVTCLEGRRRRGKKRRNNFASSTWLLLGASASSENETAPAAIYQKGEDVPPAARTSGKGKKRENTLLKGCEEINGQRPSIIPHGSLRSG